MPKKNPEDFTYLSNDPNYVPDPEIGEFMEEEISRAPKDPDLLATPPGRMSTTAARSPSPATTPRPTSPT